MTCTHDHDNQVFVSLAGANGLACQDCALTDSEARGMYRGWRARIDLARRRADTLAKNLHREEVVHDARAGAEVGGSVEMPAS
jgi:hypothetical protein